VKKIIATLMVIALLSFSAGCGEDKKINGVWYETYGLINKHEVKDSNIRYRTIVGNVVWGIILVETLVAPVYFFGFSMYEPVGPK
jgi:hypothetical protein